MELQRRTEGLSGGRRDDVQLVEEETPFQNHTQALEFAFRMEAADNTQISALLREMRGGGVRLPSRLDLCRADRVTQGAMILSLVDRSLKTDKEKAVVYGYFTVPAPGKFIRRKQDICEAVGLAVADEIKTPTWFTVDVVRGWCRLKPHHTTGWWEKHLQVSERTLQYWRSGRGNRRPGIHTMLDRLMGEAESTIVPAMRDAGLTVD